MSVAAVGPAAGNNMTLPGRSRRITVEPVEVPDPVKVPQPEPGEAQPGKDRPAIEPSQPVDPIEPAHEPEPEKIPA